MSTPLSHLIARSLMPALVVGAFALPAPIALAQQANATPPTPAEIERRKSMGGYLPERMQNPNLTSNPPRLTVTPLENIPVDKIQVPPGFKVEVWAHGIPGARMMARAANGAIAASRATARATGVPTRARACRGRGAAFARRRRDGEAEAAAANFEALNGQKTLN